MAGVSKPKDLQLWVVSTIDYHKGMGCWEGLETFRLHDAAMDYAERVRESNLCPGRAGGGWRTEGQDCWRNATLGLGVRVHIKYMEHFGCRNWTENMHNPGMAAALESAYKKGSNVNAPRDSAGTYRCSRTLAFEGTEQRKDRELTE